MKYKSIYILAVVLCLSNNIIAQTRQLKFNLITGSNGVSLGKINAITQDRQGFMWFSDQRSGAIVRYDGNHMTQYLNDPDDPNTLGGHYPECLLVDSSGVIWIGFNGSGVDRFDPVSSTFTHFRHDPNDAGSLSSDFVSAILVDHLGNLWVGTSSGLDRLDQKIGRFDHFRHDVNDPSSLSHDIVRAIYEDREGTVWIGTGPPWVRENEGGLNRFDRTTRTFTRYMHDPNDANSLASNKVRAILEDSKGNFWIGTAKEGLHTLDRKTGTIKRYPYDPKHPEKLSRPPENVEIGYDHITFIIEDAEEKLWIGTPENGINRYDPATQKITHYGNDADKSGTFKDNSGWCAHATSNGLIWLGTQEDHLFKIDLYNVNIPHFESESRVNSLCEEASSVFWMGTNRGLMIADLENGTFERFVHEPLNPNSLSSKFVRKVMKDHLGVLWIGTSFGLNRYEADNSTFTRFLHDPTDTTSLSENNISTIYEDSHSNLWVGTNGGGLNLLDRTTGKFTHYRKDDKNPSSISNDHVTAIVEDEANNLWIGLSFNAGVNRMNKKTGEFKQYLGGHIINDLYKDSGGILWAGTVNGLYRYDKKVDDFFPLSGESTGIRINSYVMAIMGDDEGNLWVSTLNGIYKLNKTRDHLIRFGKENDVVIIDADRLVVRSGYKASDGKLFFGDGNGYYSFYPNKLETLPGESKLYFTSFWLNNRAIKPDSTGPLPQSLDDTQQIQLDHHQNVFAFSFTTINFRSSEDKIMSYTLENYDVDWRQTGMGEKVNYIKVPPGNYIFRIKALNSATGTWLEKSIDVIISPPWWKTWWAYILYAIAAVATLVFAWQQVLNRERLNSRMKLEHMELEKAREMEQVKSRFFANISHEFRTPLTLLLGPIREMLSQASDYGQKNRLKMMERNAKQLLNLVNQLLDLSKLEASKLKLEAVKSDVVSFIHALGSAFGSLADHKKIEYRFNLFEGKIGLYFDRNKLETIVNNLLSNAFKFTPEGGKVDLALKRLIEGDKEWVEIQVIDSGHGIPEDQIEKIFDRFYQTDSSQTREQEGTGIGLALTKELIKLHHGSIQVQSEMGKGTTFVILLPVGKDHLKEEEIIQELPLPDLEKEKGLTAHPSEFVLSEDGGPQEKAPPKEELETESVLPIVLMVEDNPDVRSYIRGTLGNNYSVLEAENGKRGLKKAQEAIPDLILSDVMMPKMDGIELCKRLKTDERTSHIPVIILTAKGSGDNKIEGLETGADDYIIKPFEAQELLVRIKNLIQQRKMLREKFRKEIILKPKDIAVTSTDERFLNKVMEVMEANVDNEMFSVEQLGENVGMSRSQILRKLQGLTGQSASQFIRNFRLQRAMELLKKDVGTVSEIAYKVGFGSPAYFVKCFREQYGYPPGKFKSRSKT